MSPSFCLAVKCVCTVCVLVLDVCALNVSNLVHMHKKSVSALMFVLAENLCLDAGYICVENCCLGACAPRVLVSAMVWGALALT